MLFIKAFFLLKTDGIACALFTKKGAEKDF